MQMTSEAGKWIEVKPFFKYFMQMTFIVEKWIVVKPFFKYFMQMSFAKKKMQQFHFVSAVFLYFLFIFFLFFGSRNWKILWHQHFIALHRDAHLPNGISRRSNNAEIVLQVLHSTLTFAFGAEWQILQDINA